MAEEQTKKELALGSIDDLVADFAYYDRKDDDELSVDDMVDLIKSGELTQKEIIARFADAVEKWLGEEDDGE